MKSHVLILVAAFAVLSAALIFADAVVEGVRAFRRRRRRRHGTHGVVLDSRGSVLGIYLDPFSQHAHGARVHTGDSPWTTPGPDPWSGWAWEGFGATVEEARAEANRLRRRYLQLLPWLGDGAEEEPADF
ncbi:MAG TPA: hypothetical protein VHG51_07735 [Longimicrobiaceae bacterium]|nr:hypothetical protein [Longimicrobiaceae bacterium]